MFVELRSSVSRVLVLSGLIAAVSGAMASAAAQQPAGTMAGNQAQVVSNYGRLPLRFETNRGQADKKVEFLSRGRGYGLYLTGKEAVLSLHGPAGNDVVRMQLAGASNRTEPMGQDPLPGISNYLLGGDPAKWHTNVPAFGRVHYAGVYPGVDLLYYGNQQQLEFDFVVAPGADPELIRLHFAGARRLKIDDSGNLTILARDGSIAFHKPVVYQVVSGGRQPVAGKFVLDADNSAGFAVGSYDHSKPLVLDPTLIYATYLGGSTQDVISAIAVDSTGAAYLTGTTSSTDYPVTPGTVQVTTSPVFVTKMNASGTALIYSTFLGGGGSGASIAVDKLGEAYVTGWTNTQSFPVSKGAYQASKKSPSPSLSTGFMAKLNASGTGLIYATYLGGSSQDEATSLALDSAGDAYIAGFATSADFPTTSGVIQTKNNSAAVYGWNEFVAKLNPSASGPASLVYSTYLGGSDEYGGPGSIQVAVDKSGDAYVSGNAISTDFPVTPGAFQTHNNAASESSNMTLSKLNPTATKLLYSTYLGGSGSPYGDDVANGLTVDGTGNAYLTGTTHESNYPVVKGSFHTTSASIGNGLSSGFVTKMNAAGSKLVYSTYLSGSGGQHGDRAFGLALDSQGNAYIAGSAGSTDFPVTSNAFQTSNPAAFNYGASVFFTELNAAGTGLVYSTYLGGRNSFEDTGNGIALGSGGKVYLAGFTNASDFPVTTDSYNTSFNSQMGVIGFVAEVDLGAAPTTLPTATALTANSDPAVAGTDMIFTAAVVPVSGKGIPSGNVIFSIDEANVATVALNSKGAATYTHAPLLSGQHYILASYAGNSTYAPSGSGITETITPATPIITPRGGVYPTAQLVAIADAATGTAIYYTLDGSTPTVLSTPYTGPILVSSAETIRAIAAAPGSPSSAVASASYAFINAPASLAVAATAAGTTNVTVNGLVNTFGMTGTYYFQYGTSRNALKMSTPETGLKGSVLGSRLSFVPVPVSAKLTGLNSKTTYYYHVVVSTAAGTSTGAVLSFTTN